MSTIEASWGRRVEQSKSSLADRILDGKPGGEIRKKGKRETDVMVPINSDPEGPAVLLSLGNAGKGQIRFHHRGTIFRRLKR